MTTKFRENEKINKMEDISNNMKGKKDNKNKIKNELNESSDENKNINDNNNKSYNNSYQDDEKNNEDNSENKDNNNNRLRSTNDTDRKIEELESKLDNIEKDIDHKKTSKLAITSFIFAFLFAPIGLLLSVITGIVLIIKRKTLKGWGWLIPAFIISLIFTSIISVIVFGGLYAYNSINDDGINSNDHNKTFTDKIEDKIVEKIEEKAMEKVSDIMEDKMGNLVEDITNNFEDIDNFNETN